MRVSGLCVSQVSRAPGPSCPETSRCASWPCRRGSRTAGWRGRGRARPSTSSSRSPATSQAKHAMQHKINPASTNSCLDVLPDHAIPGIDRRRVVALAALFPAWCSTSASSPGPKPYNSLPWQGRRDDCLLHSHNPRTLGASVSTGQATLKKLLSAALQSKGSEPDMCTSQPASCSKRTNMHEAQTYTNAWTGLPELLAGAVSGAMHPVCHWTPKLPKLVP